MQSLIPVINKLQNVFRKTGVNNSIELPQIVVVGSQSCGKSSVLESLVGRSFLPRGTGIVTRCPIVLQLNKVDSPGASGVPFQEYCSFFEEEKKIYTDFDGFDEVRRQIELHTDKFAGTGKGISMKEIIVKVFSPNVVSLTVVDLPGLVKNSIIGQPPDIEEQVNTLILKYISNKNAVILAVSAANADIATSESLKIAKAVDPEGHRTLAVITKLDMMDKGTDASDVLNGKVINVKLGIIGVVNRSQEAINKNLPMKDALQDEEDFFRKHYPDNTEFIGSSYLAVRLHNLLVDHIRQAFPTLIVGFKQQLARLEARKLILGPDLAPTQAEKADFMIDAISDFIDKFKTAVNEPAPVKFHEKHASFTSTVAKIFDKFSDSLNYHQKNGLEEINFNKTIETAMENSVNVERYTSVEGVFKGLVKEQLQGMKNPAIICAENVWEAISNVVSQFLDETHLKKLNEVICEITRTALNARLILVKDYIEEYFLAQTEMIFSCDEEFTSLLKVPVADNVDRAIFTPVSTPKQPALFPLTTTFNKSTSDQNKYIYTLISGYLSVVRRQIADYIPKYIMLNACTSLFKNLRRTIRDETRGKENELVVETPEITKEREDNKIMIANLHKALNIIAEIRSY